MNRKEGTIMGIVVLATFITGVFAVSEAQPDPPTLQTTSVDIEVYKSETGVQVILDNPLLVPLPRFFDMSFSFAPSNRFIEVESVHISVVAVGLTTGSGDTLHAQLNSMDFHLIGAGFFPESTFTVEDALDPEDLLVGRNRLVIGLETDTLPPYHIEYSVFEVRLTVEYTFMA